MKFTLTPLLSGYDGKSTTVSSSERSAKIDSFTCTIHPSIIPTDDVIGVFNVHKAYYLNEQRTIRIQSHKRLQVVFSIGQLDHLLWPEVRYSFLDGRWSLETTITTTMRYDWDYLIRRERWWINRLNVLLILNTVILHNTLSILEIGE